MHRVTGYAVALVTLALMALPFSGCAAPNTPPEIVSLTSRSAVVAPGDSVLVECDATDPDGDELTYDWTSDRGTINGHAGVIAWTAPSEEGIARVSVEVSDGGDVAIDKSIAITVKNNTFPVMNGVTADLDWVHPGETIEVRCDAEDMDGDPLSYTWSADSGEITGDGPTVSWTAPATEGTTVIMALVEDGFGGRAKGSLSIVTSRYKPMLIDAMTVTPVTPPFYIVARADTYKVYWDDSYDIECFASEPERIVSYEWTDGDSAVMFPVGAGNIVFEGGPTVIRWTAPTERGDYTITVTARDANGSTATKSITMTVETCTCAFPKPAPVESDTSDDSTA